MRNNRLNHETRELNKLAIPLIAQSVSGMVIGLSDQMIVGRISVSAFGAIGAINALLFFLAGVIGNKAIAFNIRGSKARGGNEHEKFRNEFMAAIILDLLIGGAFTILMLFAGEAVLKLIYGFSGQALTEGKKYMAIMSLYMPIQLLLFTCNTYFKVIKNTTQIMLYATAASILNIVFDYIFVFGKLGFPAMGTTGAALGSILSLALNLLAYLFIAGKDIRFRMGYLSGYRKLMRGQLWETIPLAGQELLEGSIVVVLVHAIVARTGIVQLSSYLLVKGVLDIALMAMYMYGSATLTLVSESLGARNQNAMRRYPKEAVKLSVMMFSIVGIFLILFRGQIPQLITNDGDVIRFAASIMTAMVVMNLFNPFQEVYKYALQASGNATFVLYASLGVNGVVLGLICVLVFGVQIGIWGVFICLFLNYIALYCIFRWKYKQTAERV